MKDYKRLTQYMQVGNKTVAIQPQRKERIQLYIDRLFELEDKIESGELCEREQLVKDILIPLCKTFDSIKDYWNYYEIIYLIKEKAREYGIDLFEKTDNVEDEE